MPINHCRPWTQLLRSAPIRRSRALLFALVLAICGSAVRAERPENLGGPALPPVMRQPGDLTLRNTSLPDALLTISDLWSINIVVGQDVTGSVNGVFNQTPLQEILDAILLSNGYSYRTMGNSLVVKRLEEFGDVNPLFETATIPLGRLQAVEAVDSAKLLISPRGKVLPLESARSMLVVDFPDRIAMVRQLIGQLDASSPGQAQPVLGPRQVEVGYFETQFIPIASAKEAVSTLLSVDGKAAILADEDRLVVADYPEVLVAVERLLDQVDQPRKMIRITSFIYDISIEDMEALGVNWSDALKGKPDAAGSTAEWAIDTITSVPFAAGAAGGVMTFANMSENFDLTATINALSTCSDSRLLADPNVVVVENEEAVVSIIQEIPFQQLTQTGQGGNIGTTAFREAGVKLTVKGRVAGQETIWMQVNPEFSRLTGFTPTDNQPIIDRRTAQTVVRIVNGRTLVIGGLRQRTDVNVYTGIPYLQDLPLGVGHLFRNRETTIRESELVVFIKPEIVVYDQPRNVREEATLQTNRHFLDSIRMGECGTGQPEFQEYYEEVVPLDEQYNEVPAVEPGSGQPAPEATALRTGARLPLNASNQIMRIPAVVSLDDAPADREFNETDSPQVHERFPEGFMPTRIPDCEARPIGLPPVGDEMAVEVAKPTAGSVQRSEPLSVRSPVDNSIAKRQSLPSIDISPRVRGEHKTAVAENPLIDKSPIRHVGQGTWVYKIFRL